MSTEYTVQMHRPDRKRVTIRRFFADKPIEAASRRQLAGYLTHVLFGDSERGGADTHYVVKIKSDDMLRVFTVRKDEKGGYELV